MEGFRFFTKVPPPFRPRPRETDHGANTRVNFNLPTCIANGDYLLRIETLALHSAYSAGGAQFYTSYVSPPTPPFSRRDPYLTGKKREAPD